MLDYWRLPGPAGFLTDTLNEIGSGRNVVLVVPDCGPAGLLDRLRDALHDRWSVRTLRGDGEKSPLHAIYHCLLGDVPADSALSTTKLAADERLMGRIVFVEDVGEAKWLAWKQFVQDYELGCRLLPADRRMLIVLAARGLHAQDPPLSEVALAVLRWDGWVGEIDMLVYAALRLRGMALPHRKRQLIATCLARIALWDVEVIEDFCKGDPERILEPLEVLAQIGKNRGWSATQRPSWRDGSLHQVDGTEQTHSAYLACHEPDSIMRRVWSAQASVLLPLIEERRTALLPRVRRYITVPLETNTGIVQRLEDLEVGQMLWRLSAIGAERSLVRTVERLKRVRDALAHLEPVPRELACHPELIG